MDVAQLYMLALRPTMAPIIGESCDSLFMGQIEVEGWTWKFHNQEVRSDRSWSEKLYDEGKSELEEARKSKLGLGLKKELKAMEKFVDRAELGDSIAEMRRQVQAMKAAANTGTDKFKQLEESLSTAEARYNTFKDELNDALGEFDKSIEDLSDAQKQEQKRTKQARDRALDRQRQRVEDAERNPNFEFTFTKRIDVATTQLLNCMKAGDLLPSIVLTMHQASSNTPWTLVITVTKVRLLDYKMKVEVSDTMSDMREEWTCEFASFGYVYQNRPHAGVKSLTAGGAAQTAAKAATQGTVRTFMMKNAEFW